jgi:hypothetical protein
MSPASARSIVGIITGMKTGLASPALDEQTADAEMTILVEALSSYPEWALSKAAMRFLKDRVRGTNGKFREPYFPKVPELVRECEAQLTEARVEAARIERILKAEIVEVPTEAERAASFAAIDNAVKGFMEACGMSAMEEKRRDEERAFRAKERAEEAMRVRSDALAASRGIKATPIDDGTMLSAGAAKVAEKQREA